jgi:hypothetical protein
MEGAILFEPKNVALHEWNLLLDSAYRSNLSECKWLDLSVLYLEFQLPHLSKQNVLPIAEFEDWLSSILGDKHGLFKQAS